MRLIDVDDLGVGRCSKDVLPAAYCAGWNGLLGLVEKAPTVDAVPVVHGCFEPCFDENGNWRQGFAKCSNCGKEYYAQVINHFGYCPNCGAKMDGERKDGGDG